MSLNDPQAARCNHLVAAHDGPHQDAGGQLDVLKGRPTRGEVSQRFRFDQFPEAFPQGMNRMNTTATHMLEDFGNRDIAGLTSTSMPSA